MRLKIDVEQSRDQSARAVAQNQLKVKELEEQSLFRKATADDLQKARRFWALFGALGRSLALVSAR